MKKWFKDHWLYLLILTVLTFVTYGNTLNNAFLSDDIAEIRDNPLIGNLGYAVSSHPFGFIRLLLYWMAYRIGDLNPLFFRLINIFFHLGSVYLIYVLLNLIYFRKIAFFVAAIFAVHPAISEAVVWISGGMYPQYTFFFLLSFLFYIFAKKGVKFYWLSVVAFLMALMSHPAMPLALFLIFPLFEFAFGNWKKNWLKVIPFLILATGYTVLNLVSLPERTTTLQSVHYQERGVDNIFLLIPVAITSYFELIFWPKILTLYHSELAFNQIQFLFRALLTLLFFAAIIFSFFKKRPLFFWLSLFVIALSPTLTPFRLNWIVAERYLYLPIIGIVVLFVLGVEKLSQLKPLKPLKFASLILFCLIILALSLRTIFRNIDWKSEDNLWIATGKTSPSSPNTHNNLGDVYGRWGDKQKALQEFQTAIALKPNYADAYHNLANTYRELGQIDQALENYQNAIKFNPHLWQSYQNIAALYFDQKKYDQAIEYLQKAIQINPKSVNLKNNLGVVYFVFGQKEKAREIFMQVLTQDPQNQFAKQALIELSR